MKHLQYTYETSETLANIRLHHALSAQHISFAAWENESSSSCGIH
jgi:hypothetical protein